LYKSLVSEWQVARFVVQDAKRKEITCRMCQKWHAVGKPNCKMCVLGRFNLLMRNLLRKLFSYYVGGMKALLLRVTGNSLHSSREKVVG